MGKSRVRNFLRPPPPPPPPPPPRDRMRLFTPHLFQFGLNFKPARKNTPKLVVPPPLLAWLNLFLPPPPYFCRGKTSHAPPPSRFVAPRPPPLPMISDQSLVISGLRLDYGDFGPFGGSHADLNCLFCF